MMAATSPGSCSRLGQGGGGAQPVDIAGGEDTVSAQQHSCREGRAGTWHLLGSSGGRNLGSGDSAWGPPPRPTPTGRLLPHMRTSNPEVGERGPALEST